MPFIGVKKMELPSKLVKDVKELHETKKKEFKNESDWDWKPIATDFAILVARNLASGYFFKLGGSLYDFSFNRQKTGTSLALHDGGKKTFQAV